MRKRGLWKPVLPLALAALLAITFCLDGGAPSGDAPGAVAPAIVSAAPAASEPDTPSPTAEPEPSPEAAAPAEVLPETPDAPDASAPDSAPAQPPAPSPEEPPLPAEEPDGGTEDGTCTLSVSCAALAARMDLCAPEKAELVPEDGWILEPVEVPFTEGESVFDVLQRACRQAGVHMEYENTPLYGSAYIEGIGNLYEFDAGALSGWMYAVNGWFPNYGCSQYLLADGDEVCWRYTCDLGRDIGGAGAQQGR